LSPPLRKGGAAVRQRLGGLLFLFVIIGLVLLTVALYQKRFANVVMVDLETDAIGNQLTVHGDVKIRGLVVGEVREVRTDGDGATVRMAIDEDKAEQVPVEAVGQLLPKTLFGEKFVNLVPPADPARGVREGDVMQQDRSKVFLETEKVFDDVLPLLKSLKPDDLSRTLNALSGALRGRGNRLGENAELTDAYLKRLNPSLPEIQDDLRGLADLADTLDQAAPDFLAVFDNLSFSSRSLVDQQQELATFLGTTTTFAGSTDSFLRDNEQRFVRLAADSRLPLQLYERYSPQSACLLKGLVAAEHETANTFGGLQPGLHITLETTRDQGGYIRGDEPSYADTSDPTCRGLPGSGEFPEKPFPVYREAPDGYCDEYERSNPGVQMESCPRPGNTNAAAFSAASEHDLLALVSSPVLGKPAEDVGDLADLLLGPMARGTEVRVG